MTEQSRSEFPSRRRFLTEMSAAAAAFTIVPARVMGRGAVPPSDLLNIAAIGSGGMGSGNIERSSTENIVALCDVDDVRAAEVYKKYPKAKKYRDFRKMLEDNHKNIDAVIVATPDHTHAVAAMAAIELGKHVYVQKPLTHSVYEARALTNAAREHNVMTQMGNQGHSGEETRILCEWIWDGAIGPVHEVHCWTDRPVWPSGVELDRPVETPPIPDTLSWYLWLGPAADRPYSPQYLPGIWRGWVDFGTGALGDMGCHIMDAAFWSLKLKYPIRVQANASRYYSGMWERAENKMQAFPRSSVVHYTFPAREGMPELKLHWYDGGMKPARPDELEPGRRLPDNGLLFIGEKGVIMSGSYGSGACIIPETQMAAYQRPAKTLPRIPNGAQGHEQDWIRACKDNEPACSNFEYSGPLSEMVLMGNLAIFNPGEVLEWDGENMVVTNNETANAYVNPPYRDGWSL